RARPAPAFPVPAYHPLPGEEPVSPAGYAFYGKAGKNEPRGFQTSPRTRKARGGRTAPPEVRRAPPKRRPARPGLLPAPPGHRATRAQNHPTGANLRKTYPYQSAARTHHTTAGSHQQSAPANHRTARSYQQSTSTDHGATRAHQ